MHNNLTIQAVYQGNPVLIKIQAHNREVTDLIPANRQHIYQQLCVLSQCPCTRRCTPSCSLIVHPSGSMSPEQKCNSEEGDDDVTWQTVIEMEWLWSGKTCRDVNISVNIFNKYSYQENSGYWIWARWQPGRCVECDRYPWNGAQDQNKGIAVCLRQAFGLFSGLESELHVTCSFILSEPTTANIFYTSRSLRCVGIW